MFPRWCHTSSWQKRSPAGILNIRSWMNIHLPAVSPVTYGALPRVQVHAEANESWEPD